MFLEMKYILADIKNIINAIFMVMYPLYLAKYNRFHYLPSIF